MKDRFYIFSTQKIKIFFAALLLGISRLPLGLGFLVFFAFIPLFSYFEEEKNKKIITSAILFSFVYTATCLHWISLVTLPGLIGIFIIFSVYYAIIFWILSKFWEKFHRFCYFLFIILWVSFEFGQNFTEFRFPWCNVGYSLAEYDVLLQVADIGGIYLLSILAILVNLIFYKIFTNSKMYIISLFMLLFLWVGYGMLRLENLELEYTSKKASIVQVSIKQEQKWQPGFFSVTKNLYEEYTKKAVTRDVDLVIWPESAMTTYLLKRNSDLKFVKRIASENEIGIFTGFQDYEVAESDYPEKYKFYNACTLIDKNENVYPAYYKNFLVPFGERMPLLDIFPFLWNIHLGQANFEYGTRQKFYSWQNLKFSPFICFEIVFPALTRKMADKEIDFIVNITNDAWFKRSVGTYQHAMMAKFRAIETRKPVFRAANTGYSMIVSPTGKIEQMTELYEKIILAAEIITLQKKTLYVRYFYLFPYFLLVISGVFIIFLLIKSFIFI